MRGLWRRALELFRPGRLDREAVEEMELHIEMLVERKRAAGLEPREARRQALAEAGSVSHAREEVGSGRTGYLLEQLAREARHAGRVLWRSPGLTLLSLVTLGAGIGVSAILFALIDGIVLTPLPYPEPDRIVRIFDTNLQTGIDRTGAASGNLDDWRRSGAFERLAGGFAMGRTLIQGDDAEVLITAQVSRDFFETLRVPPALGRTFTEEETDRALFNNAASPIGADPVVILSHAVWMQRFGGDPDVVGKTIVLDRRSFQIVGVMQQRFAMPDAGVQLWIPWGITAEAPRDQHYLVAIGRLADGVTIAQAEEMLNSIARRLGEDHPDTNRGWGVSISPLATETFGEVASTLWLLLAAVGLVLLVVCANVALLAVMRGLDRREETAVRLALGASTGRLLREFLMESVLLALLGGALGAGIAAAGIQLLPALTTDLPRLNDVTFDARALAFIAAVAGLCALLSGLPQAWRSARVAPLAGLSAGGPRATESRDRHWLRDGIVVVHVALAAVLTMGAALLVRSFVELRGAEPGFDPRGVLVAPVFLDMQKYDTGEKTRDYYGRLFEEISALPGVVAVGGATTVPTSPLGPDFARPVWLEGTNPEPADRASASVRMVTPGYLRAMGLRIVEGRAIDDHDAPDGPRVLMISETLAKQLAPSGRAVGRKLMVDYSTAGTYPLEIVGVVEDLKFSGPRSEPLPEIYIPHAQRSYLVMNVVVKTSGDPRASIPSVRAALKDVDPQKPAHGIYPLEDLLGATYARDRHVMFTLLVFALSAALLAALSVYGALSQRVRERSREIGIRMAMGANAPNVIRLVAGSGLRLIALGLAAGILAARLLTGALEGLLFGVAPTDLPTTLLAMAALAAIGTLAALAPSWRAARIDPVEILRRG